GKPLRYLFPEGLSPESELERAAAEGRAFSEGWRRRRDGSMFWSEVYTSALFDGDGVLRGFSRIARDATSRKRAADLLRASNEALEALVRSAPIAVVSLDQLGRVRLWNPAAEQLFAVAEADAMWKPHPLGAAMDELLDRVRDGTDVNGAELRWTRPDGRQVVLGAWVSALHDARGEYSGAMLVAADVTERKALEDALKRDVVFRERFMGILGHDLRNPLNAITLSASTLLRRGGLDPATERGLRRISASAARMARMIRDLLEFARSRIGEGLPLDRRRMDLAEVVRDAVDEVAAAYPERPFVVEGARSAVGLWDPDRLTQVVSNLLGNAVQHGTPGTPIAVGLEEEEGWVVLSVHNEGAPISPERLPHLFDAFSRAGGGERGEGLGLGLYIVAQIVRAHGGTVDVQSSDGSGTTFFVRLPAAQPADHPSISPA
ncbi:MAG: ATP-binding protein, partial [Myxococcales bacterium]